MRTRCMGPRHFVRRKKLSVSWRWEVLIRLPVDEFWSQMPVPNIESVTA